MRGQVYVCVLSGATMVIAPHLRVIAWRAPMAIGVRRPPCGMRMARWLRWQHWRFVSDCIEMGVYSENGPMPP